MKILVTEQELENIIIETIEKTLKEENEIINISTIDIKKLKSIYRDFRLTPTLTVYDNVLHTPFSIKEAFGDIQDPDEVIEELSKKYDIPNGCILKKEAYNKIYIYVVTAMIGINDKLIEEDMSKMGYFLGFKGKIQEVENMKFQILQFEPLSQLQNDETEVIKNENTILYHWTPQYLVKSIIENGLIPNNKNSRFNYPPRTYLIKSDCSDKYLYGLGQSLCISNDDPQNDGKYVLLSVNIENLEDNIKFYFDPNSEFGIYTEQLIPKERIKVVNAIQFIKKIK